MVTAFFHLLKMALNRVSRRCVVEVLAAESVEGVVLCEKGTVHSHTTRVGGRFDHRRHKFRTVIFLRVAL